MGLISFRSLVCLCSTSRPDLCTNGLSSTNQSRGKLTFAIRISQLNQSIRLLLGDVIRTTLHMSYFTVLALWWVPGLSHIVLYFSPFSCEWLTKGRIWFMIQCLYRKVGMIGNNLLISASFTSCVLWNRRELVKATLKDPFPLLSIS